MSRTRKILLPLLLGVSVVLIFSSLAGPYIGLGRNAEFILYKHAFINRRETLIAGIILFQAFLLVHLAAPVPRSNARPARKRWFMISGILLLFFVGLKIFDNFILETVTQNRFAFSYGGPVVDLRHDPGTGWVLSSRQTVEDSIPFRPGMGGYRDQLVPAEKVGNPSILMLGDGLVQGVAVDRNPARILGTMVAVKNLHEDADPVVNNLAMYGGTARQASDIVRHHGRLLEPDLIVLFAGPAETRIAAQFGVDVPPAFIDQVMTSGTLWQNRSGTNWLEEFLPATVGSLFRALSSRDAARTVEQRLDGYRQAKGLEGAPSPEVAAGGIAEAVRTIRRDIPDAPVILAFPPAGEDLDAELYSRVRERLHEWLGGDPDIRLIDLSQTFIRPAFSKPGYYGNEAQMEALMQPIADFIAAMPPRGN